MKTILKKDNEKMTFIWRDIEAHRRTIEIMKKDGWEVYEPTLWERIISFLS